MLFRGVFLHTKPLLTSCQSARHCSALTAKVLKKRDQSIAAGSQDVKTGAHALLLVPSLQPQAVIATKR